MFDPKVIKTLALLSQLGISMLVPVFLMLWLGSWMNDRFGLQIIPLFILLGIGAGLRNCYLLLKNAVRDSENSKK